MRRVAQGGWSLALAPKPLPTNRRLRDETNKMAVSVTQTFPPGPRLIDGTDLNNLVAQIVAALASAGTDSVSIPITLSALANAQLISLPIPVAFRVTAMSFTVGTAVTTGSKAATLTCAIGGTNVTGGVLALTSANCTPAGTNIAATAITAGNVGAAGALLGVNVTSVTTFIEGNGILSFTVANAAIL